MIKNLFGTDGIRGTVGTYPFKMEQLPHLGNAIALWILEKYGANARIVLAADTRESGPFLKAALQSGLLLHPLMIFDAGVLSTPAVCLLTQNLYECGIIISASHNHYLDNGIKIVTYDTGKISYDDELRISFLFSNSSFDTYTYSSMGNNQFLEDASTEDYEEYFSSFFQPNFLKGRKIVLDCAHGALYQLAPRIFTLFGAELVVLNNDPDGTNINHQCGALHPQELQQAVVEHNADIGFAFDGDGDRVIGVSKHGELKDGDDMLAVLLQHPLFASTSTIVGTDMTNYGFECYINSRQKKLIRTAVGDKYVAQKLEQENLLLGGEQSGHIIMRDYLATGDGLFTAFRILEALEFSNNWDMKTFEKYPQILINVPITSKKDLARDPFATLIAESSALLHSGRIIVRYSGTENLLRIMIEDNELQHAQHIGSALSKALQKELS